MQRYAWPDSDVASSMAFRVSLVNLQKFTLASWVALASIGMFAPAENTRSFADVITTAPTAGCSNRSLCMASWSSMSTPRS